MRRISGIVLLLVGILLVAAAGVVRWAVAPAVTVLPSDTNTTRVYTGTAASALNPTLLTGKLSGPAILKNLPATVTHTVKVVDTTAHNALVTDRKAVSVAGQKIADYTDRYAVDRKNMGHGTGFSGVTANQTGITFNWPIDTKKHNYTGWSSDAQKTVTLHYVGTAKRGGIDTYVFTDSLATSKITNEVELEGLPQSLPKSALASLAPSLGLSAAQLQQMATVLPTLPDPIPLAYTISATGQYWVAPDSGLIVDTNKHEVRTVNVTVAGQLVPIAPVLDLTYSAPASTLAAAVKDAKDKASSMTLIRTTLPAIAGGVGILFVIVGAALLVGRRRTPAVPSVITPRTPTPVG